MAEKPARNWVTRKVLQGMPSHSDITAQALADATGIERNQIYDCVEKLRRRKLIDKIVRGKYRLTPTGRAAQTSSADIRSGPDGPNGNKRPRKVKGTLRERVWRALRAEGKSTVPELVELAAAGSEAGAENNAAKYLWVLTEIGYVKRMQRRAPGLALTSNGHVRYWLVKDTGPRAPVYRERRGSVYDPNTDEEIALPGKDGGEAGPAEP